MAALRLTCQTAVLDKVLDRLPIGAPRRRRGWSPWLPVGAVVLALGCGPGAPSMIPDDLATSQPSAGDPADVPIAALGATLRAAFNDGDELFSLVLREHDGLGPLYTRESCDGCHSKAARGPGAAQKMVVMEPGGLVPSADQSKLPFGNTVHPLVTAGATLPIVPPPGDPSVKVSTRLGPPVLGRGYLEAIADDELVRVAAEQAGRSDGIHGRVNHAIYRSQPNPDPTFDRHKPGDVIIGRFGLKARIADLDDFVADALQGDMGITSAMRPIEFKNPEGRLDDDKPGIDVGPTSVNSRAMYVRLLAIPARPDAAASRGRALFQQALCGVCHVEAMRTRADYPIANLAGIDAPVYTDLLLHDMGDLLADGVQKGDEGEAGPRDWRTAPLIGLRFNLSFLHDGRAATLADAVLQHAGPGSEANGSVDAFKALPEADRAALLEFLGGL